MVVDQVIPLALEFLVRDLREFDDEISWLLSESNIAFTWEPDFFFAWDCAHARLHFNKPCNSDDPFISSVIDPLYLIELYLLLASEDQLFKCALHLYFKVLGSICLSPFDTRVLADLFESSYLISLLIECDSEWVTSAEELLEDLIDVP